MPEIRHGTYGGYTNGACRCDECREAGMTAQRRRRALAKDRERGVMAQVNHGTASGYTNGGCRCPECRRANTVATRERRHAKYGGRQTAAEYERSTNGRAEKAEGRRALAREGGQAVGERIRQAMANNPVIYRKARIRPFAEMDDLVREINAAAAAAGVTPNEWVVDAIRGKLAEP